MRILVTGATGFVGRAIIVRLREHGGFSIYAGVHRDAPDPVPGIGYIKTGDVNDPNCWRDAMQGKDVVVHTAARVHIMRDNVENSLARHRYVNTAGTLNVAGAAAASGVRRFIFISSIKVNGERTLPNAPFTADMLPTPADPYAISKLEAEVGLREIAGGTGMQVTIVRPPLVYGPGVKGNFHSMMTWLHRGVPLPLGAVTKNRRSVVALDNLADLVVLCVEHPAAGNQTFLVADGEDLSTSDLLRRLGRALGRPARLLPIPMGVLSGIVRMTGREEFARRLLESLELDISKTRELLGWRPPLSVDRGLELAARAFLDRLRR